METLIHLSPVVSETQDEVTSTKENQFITANTESISFDDLKSKCIIPVFRDNESTISHPEFIQAVLYAAQSYFKRESFSNPAVRVSHPIKGRTPEAIGKPVEMLLDREKTLYYERCAWITEIPSIRETVNGNELSLTVGGVKSYQWDNLYSAKREEKFSIFIGFKNKVCCNLCIWTDGFKAEIKARSVNEIVQEAFTLFSNFRPELQISSMSGLGEDYLTEHQFAQLVGRSRLYQFLPAKIKKEIPDVLPLMDSQISTVTRDYYSDKSFCRTADGNIDLWKLYNLFTGANKSSYIDTFLSRGVNSHLFIQGLQNALKTGSEHWWLS